MTASSSFDFLGQQRPHIIFGQQLHMFLLQIVTPEGIAARFPGGGPLEREFIQACVDAIVAKGVGIGRTEAHVAIVAADAIRETILALKADTRYAIKD